MYEGLCMFNLSKVKDRVMKVVRNFVIYKDTYLENIVISMDVVSKLAESPLIKSSSFIPINTHYSLQNLDRVYIKIM